jgi:hypothetical protein
VPPSRVRGMPPPLASNPHRFHEDRSEIAHDIAQVARIIAPRRVRRSVAVEISAERSGRAIIASQVINGSAGRSSAGDRSLSSSDEGENVLDCGSRRISVRQSEANSGEFRE